MGVSVNSAGSTTGAVAMAGILTIKMQIRIRVRVLSTSVERAKAAAQRKN